MVTADQTAILFSWQGKLFRAATMLLTGPKSRRAACRKDQLAALRAPERRRKPLAVAYVGSAGKELITNVGDVFIIHATVERQAKDLRLYDAYIRDMTY